MVYVLQDNIMNGKKDFSLKCASEEDLIRIQKNIAHNRQKQKDAQHWDDYVKSNTDYKMNSIQSRDEFKHHEPLFSEGPLINQSISFDSGDIYSLHDPHDLNHIHGLRNRLFKTFNEFSKILNNAFEPSVLKITKKVLVKIKNSDQNTSKNYIFDLNLLLTEIKKESKNENLHTKKNKTNVMLKKGFQMKLIRCYKLSIDTIQLCTKTLRAGVYNPIQSKMKNLLQIISTLSLISRKYLYGELFKKKKKESFDLVEQCKHLEKMLDECGYKDTDNENHDNIQHSNLLNELSKKASFKNKIQSFSTNQYSNIYTPTKLKVGSDYANKWSNKSLESAKNIEINNEYSSNKIVINKLPISLNYNHLLHSYDTNINSDEIKTKIEDYHYEEEIDNNSKETKNSRFNYNHKVINFPNLTKTLKSNNNVGLFILKENIWRNFHLKNLNLSENGCLRLFISPRNVKDIFSYKQQFNQIPTEERLQIVNILFNVTESIMDDLIKEVLLQFENKIIYELMKMELFE